MSIVYFKFLTKYPISIYKFENLSLKDITGHKLTSKPMPVNIVIKLKISLYLRTAPVFAEVTSFAYLDKYPVFILGSGFT